MPEIIEELGDPARVSVLSERGGKGSPAFCACGTRLQQPPTGRKRFACSPLCQRRRDALVKKIRRVREALDLWRAERRMGRYSQAQIRTEMKVLREELDALERELHGGQV